MADKLLKEYKVEADKVEVSVKIAEREGEFVRSYLLDIPQYGRGTEALLDSMKRTLIADTTLKADKMLDDKTSPAAAYLVLSVCASCLKPLGKRMTVSPWLIQHWIWLSSPAKILDWSSICKSALPYSFLCPGLTSPPNSFAINCMP